MALTPYYQDDSCTIYHGDCREILPHLEPVDLVLTDPPYGEVNRETNGLRKLDKGVADIETMEISELTALILPKGQSFYVWCGTEQVSAIRESFVRSGLSTRLCIWEKSNPSPMNGEYLWLSGLEACVFGKKPNAYFNAFCAVPVWRGCSEHNQQHPTQKPSWLFSKLIDASCPQAGTILDPFMGSGTTLRAAKDLGRKAIGIEIEEKYCEIAVKRLAQEVLPL
jgi:site-specific DNA-methyltransferase (adenine-specific)